MDCPLGQEIVAVVERWPLLEVHCICFGNGEKSLPFQKYRGMIRPKVYHDGDGNENVKKVVFNDSWRERVTNTIIWGMTGEWGPRE